MRRPSFGSECLAQQEQHGDHYEPQSSRLRCARNRHDKHMMKYGIDRTVYVGNTPVQRLEKTYP